MKTSLKVLAVGYSQTGQLRRALDALLEPLRADAQIDVTTVDLQPAKPYPFPWPVVAFFDQFPECVHLDPPELAPTGIDPDAAYDLVIFAYQPWYLSPSPPATAFLKSQAARVLDRSPLLTLTACRNMWQESHICVRRMVEAVGGSIREHIALVDQGSAAATFVTTPRWMLTGHSNAFLGLPPAGIAEADYLRTREYGERVLQALKSGAYARGGRALQGLDTAPVDLRYALSEKLGRRSFWVWGAILRAAGKQGALQRIPLLGLYAAFLGAAICTVVPLIWVGRSLYLAAPAFAARARRKAYEGLGLPRPEAGPEMV